MIKQRHGLGGLAITNAQFSNGGGEAITITDADGYVCITMTDKPLRLSAEQARYLAMRLGDAADRIETRTAT